MRRIVARSKDPATLGIIYDPGERSFRSANGGHKGSRRPTKKVAG